MSEPSVKRTVGVGAFIFIGLLFLVGGVLAVGNLRSTFTKKMTIVTVFDDVSGLQEGNNIWFSGVKVGTVKKIEFTGRAQVRVTMNINVESRQYIRKDALVKIGSDGLIGNKILVIYGGSASAPAVEEGDRLMNEKALATEEIMETFQQSNRNVLALTESLMKGEGTIGQLLKNDSVYRDIAYTANSLRVASANANVFFASLSEYGNKLNRKGSLANDLVTDTVIYRSVVASVRQLEGIADTAGVLVSKLKKASTNPKSPFGVMIYDEQAGANLKSTIGNLESSSKKLDQNLEALKHSFLLRKYFKKEEKKKQEATQE
jgi:phospholipid/cholesterol/gamma-HCH transport system substrate-binding protein